MRIITCASYFGTGSSAVTDLISEYDNVSSLGDYEFSFAYCTDGLSDLEHHIVEAPNRNNSGFALKRFEKISRFNAGRWFNRRYEAFFHGQYWKFTQEYIDKLLEFKTPGYRFDDVLSKGIFFYYVNSLVWHISKKIGIPINMLPSEQQYYSHLDEDTFLKYTKEYTSKLLNSLINKTDYLMIDQLLPSSNIDRCLRYFEDNIYVFVVDRDPRDVFLANKYIWKDYPSKDPYEFCKWFRFTHECSKGQKTDAKKVLFLNFEDLIYNYEETVSKVEAMIGINKESHSNQFACFNPKQSINNTRLWEKLGTKEEIEIIASELPEYLYDFSQVKDTVIFGNNVENLNIF